MLHLFSSFLFCSFVCKCLNYYRILFNPALFLFFSLNQNKKQYLNAHINIKRSVLFFCVCVRYKNFLHYIYLFISIYISKIVFSYFLWQCVCLWMCACVRILFISFVCSFYCYSFRIHTSLLQRKNKFRHLTQVNKSQISFTNNSLKKIDSLPIFTAQKKGKEEEANKEEAKKKIKQTKHGMTT